MIQKEKIIEYYNRLLASKHSRYESGFEKNDRSLFVTEVLKALGYDWENILDDVSQKTPDGSRSADIRLYGGNEVKSKHSHSQFVIETKDFGILNSDINNIDFLQLKRYLIANKGKIRLICTTDFRSLFVFNATKIRKDHRINVKDTTYITEKEKQAFQENLLYVIHFDSLQEEDFINLRKLSYDAVFTRPSFIDPGDYKETNSISDPVIRKNFILNLYRVMKDIHSVISHDFYNAVYNFKNKYEESPGKEFIKGFLRGEANKIIRNYYFWGLEMNYLPNFLHNSYVDKGILLDFLNDGEKNDTFILTSIYNIINQVFFLRILEDISTENTKFVNIGAENYRYLSDGILNTKIKEGNIEALTDYLKDVFEFEKPDLSKYSFLLKKDIYSWIWEYIDPYNLLKFITLFNDINFGKLNQDILGDIYEHYLDQNGEEGKSFRKLLGQYYTPRPIVRFMWTIMHEIINQSLQRDLYEKDKPYLDVLDPAYGSGTFLFEALLHINKVAVKKPIEKDGKVWGFIKDRNQGKKVENHLYGFEINPLSKSIADVNLFFGLVQAYGNKKIDEEQVTNLKLYRTDSLDLDYGLTKEDKDEIHNLTLFELLPEDVQSTITERSEIVKAKRKKYDIIVANPPYGHITPNAFIAKKLIPFVYAENNFDEEMNEIAFNWERNFNKGVVPQSEKNVGNIRDMYICFFGVADKLIKDNGIIAFITSNTYLSLHTYKWFRKYILQNYKIHYLINFNKISEKSLSMFSPEAAIATCIIVIEKKKPQENHYINYLDLSDIGSIKEKYDAFCEINWSEKPVNKNDIVAFKMKNLDSMGFVPILQKSFLNNLNYILLASPHDVINNKVEKDACPVTEYSKDKKKYSGVFLGDVSLFADTDIGRLKKKIQDNIFNQNPEKIDAQLLREKVMNNIKEHSKRFVEDHFIKYIPEGNFSKYHYRDALIAYWDEKLLVRPGQKENVFNSHKLIIVERRGKNGMICGYVSEKEVVIQNAGRNYYILPDPTLPEGYLYAICAIINSSLIQFYYRTRLQGSRVLPIKDLNSINPITLENLINYSKEIQALKADLHNFLNGDLSSFSYWFYKNIAEKIEIINIFDENQYWQVKTSGFYNGDLEIIDLKIEQNKIHLNENLYIVFQNNEMAQKMYDHLKDSISRFKQLNDIIINVKKVFHPEEFQEYEYKTTEKICELEKHIDHLVFDIYDITSAEREIIHQSMQ